MRCEQINSPGSLPPELFIYTVSFGIGSYTVTLKWHAIADHHYTVTLYCDNILLLNQTTIAIEVYMEALNYTDNCSASVTAINCFGDENTSVINFTEGRVYYIRLVTVSVISL